MSENVVRNAAGKRIRVIPATLQRYSAFKPTVAKLRVAAYARVSTDEEEQQNSQEAQIDYYTKKIRANPEWIFVEVYADEGITGTSTKRRKNFNRMIEDALAGKIDRIITKSISRFARNTVDMLTTVRKLKDKGVGVTFEKENIDTLDSKGELFITIMSSLAQQESQSISENVAWGWRKRNSDGKVAVCYSRFLGYKRGAVDKDGKEGPMQIVEEEAKIVREIYAMFLDGKNPSGIARSLTERGIPTPAKKQKWSPASVQSILTNEKYKGDARLQKTFKPDFLSKIRVNRGEIPQFYVENSHPAIVAPEIFDLVQYEMARRRYKSKHTSSVSVFSNHLVCGECGAFFGSKVWHSNDPYRSIIWRCNHKYEKGEQRCHTPHVREEEIKAAFQTALEQMLERRQEIIAVYEELAEGLADTKELEQAAAQVQMELDALYLELDGMVRKNAETAQNQDEYKRAFDALAVKCDELKENLQRINDQIAEKIGRKRQLEAFIAKLKQVEGLTDFDEHVFAGTVEQVIVNRAERKNEKRLTFCFKDGTEITV